MGRAMGWIGRGLRLRLNRRYFWAGFVLLALATAAARDAYPWVLNGGFVLPWVLLHGGRLHDLGVRGLWAAGAVTVALVVLIVVAVSIPAGSPMVAGLAAAVSFLGLAIFTLWLGARPGDPGPNRFGPRPDGWRLFSAEAG